MTLVHEDGERRELTLDTDMFALIEKSLFKQDVPDFQTTINDLDEHKNFVSLNKIIEKARSANFSGSAQMYKLYN